MKKLKLVKPDRENDFDYRIYTYKLPSGERAVWLERTVGEGMGLSPDQEKILQDMLDAFWFQYF